jgi:hypothetical protein
LPRGSLLLVGRCTAAAVAPFAAAAPAALIVVEIPTGEIIGLTEFDDLRRAGAAAVVTVDRQGPNPDVLILAARAVSVSLRGQIGPRLRLLGYPVPAACESAVERLVGGQLSWRAREWAAAAGESVRALERRCAERWHVPSPRRWIELVQVIRAVQAVQAQSGRSVEGRLMRAGFDNARTTRELMKRVSDTTPAQARDLIGWYWIVEAWCDAFW